MLPEIHLGPLTLYTFGIMIIFGSLVGGFLGFRRYSELDYPGQWAWDLTILLMLAGVFGGATFFVLENGQSILDVPSLVASGRGLSAWGGVIGGIGVATAYSLFRRMPFWDMFSGIIFGFVATQTFGRVGCQLAGDGDYGIPWDGPWAMSYENGVVPTPPGVTVHPTPIYESLGSGIILFFLWRYRWRFSQQVLCGAWMMGAALVRFPVEFVRRNPEVFMSLTVAQWVSLFLFFAGLIIVFLYKDKPGVVPLKERASIPNLRFFPWERNEKKDFLKNLQS